jgi:FlaA1/EpsC-like NDP-sugar epimerase
VQLLHHILQLPRPIKRFISLAADASAILLALTISHALAIYPNLPQPSWHWAGVYAVLTVSSALVFLKLGLYRAVVRYLSFRALLMVSLGVLASTLLLVLFTRWLNLYMPLQSVVNYGLIAMLLIGGSRLTMRGLFHRSNKNHKVPVLIYGAGSAGRQLAQALISGGEFHPAVFVDDDATLHRSSILGIPVASPANLAAALKKHRVDRILLA